MNHTTARVARYAGAGLAGIATSWVLAAPALAMLPPAPDPVPGSDHQTTSTSSSDNGSAPATQTSISSASDGTDWSVLAAGLAGGAILGGVVVVGATQVRRHQAHPA
jgi:hypothetical protein